ncbi:hypothetical protein BFJ68_g15882 [Fusarium oxysporum]|uniref:Uncharacterized protein n=1 Tax=Fusarium oxysporum TaxID=5507 RepID=A0A420PIZ5_FUSOX|nr:hypothetical protein BFJ68_g15882 [Fusarium oxysporum]
MNSLLDMPFTQPVAYTFNLLKILASHSFSIPGESASTTRESRFRIS